MSKNAKVLRESGKDECLGFSNGTTVHFVANTDGPLGSPVSLDMCINVEFPGDGGRLTLVLKFPEPDDLREFHSYVARHVEVMDKQNRM